MKKNILSLFLLLIALTLGNAQEQIVEAISFNGEKLYRYETTPENKTKYLAKIDSLLSKNRLTEEEYISLSRYYVGLSQFNNAIGKLTEGIKKYPNSFKLLRNRGHRYINTRQLDKAITDLEKADSFMNDETSKVIEYYESGRINATYEFKIWYHIGLYHYLKGNFPKAVEAYKKCLSLAINSENVVEATDWLYNSLNKNGDYEAAQAIIAPITKDYDTNQKYAYFRRIMLYKGELQPEELIDPNKPISEWHPGDTTYAYAIGTWYALNGDQTNADKYFQGIQQSKYWNFWGNVVTDMEFARDPSKVTTHASNSEDFQPKDLPLIFRRTTLIVRDIEKSLDLYRDIMGMEVIYDTKLTRPHPKEDRDQIVRLVFLKALNNYYGVLGLMEYDYGYPNKIVKEIKKEGFTEQNVVLLFNSNTQEKQFEKIKNLKGIEIIKEPTLREYPSYDGKSKTRVMVAIFYDPDGFIVEFNKILDDL